MFGINISKPTVKQQLMIGGVVVVFLFLTYFIYVKYVVPLINKRDSANLEHNTQKDGIQQKNVEVMFFFADWCPHCTKAKPHWNKLKSSETVGKGKVVNGYSILYTEVDCMGFITTSGFGFMNHPLNRLGIPLLSASQKASPGDGEDCTDQVTCEPLKLASSD